MAPLEEALAQIRAAQTADEPVRTRILDFCASHPDALYRSCRQGHLTGSALVIDRRAERTLLIHHAKLDRWLQPGGHADGDGDLGRVALREAEEETGLTGLRLTMPAIDLDVHEIPARRDEPRHLHLDLRFLVLAADDEEPSINHEAVDFRWVSSADPEGLIGSGELRRLVDRGMVRAAELNETSNRTEVRPS